MSFILNDHEVESKFLTDSDHINFFFFSTRINIDIGLAEIVIKTQK
jgi:hypothetical protein